MPGGANLQATTHIMHSIIFKPSYNEPDQKNSTLAIKWKPRKSSDEKNLTLTSRHQPTINSKRPRGYVCFRTIDKDVWVCVCAREKCKQSNDAYVLYAMLMWMYHLSELSDSSRKAWNHNITFAASGPTIALHMRGTVLHVCVCVLQRIPDSSQATMNHEGEINLNWQTASHSKFQIFLLVGGRVV